MRCPQELGIRRSVRRDHPFESLAGRSLWPTASIGLLLVLGNATASGCSPVGVYGEGSELEEQLESPVLGAEAEGTDGSERTSGAIPSESRALAHESLSNEAIYALLADKSYRGEGFRLVNPEPYPSTVAPGKTVSLWITDAVYDDMLAVSPEETGSEIAMPVGTVIVREVFAGAELDTITVMVKLPRGAFPLGGDYWYAAADADGKIRQNADDGTPVAGLLERCGTCHLRRSQDDFLFGVPAGYLP